MVKLYALMPLPVIISVFCLLVLRRYYGLFVQLIGINAMQQTKNDQQMASTSRTFIREAHINVIVFF